MAQRLIGFNTNFELRDLSDVIINNPKDFDIILRTGEIWANIPIDVINPFTMKIKVVTENFVAESNTVYIVNTKNDPITCLLPPAPQVGDRIIFVDALSDLEGSSCDVGWGTNPFTISANINSTILGSAYITKTLDGDSLHLLYSVCDSWTSITPVTRQATEIVAGIARIATMEEVIIGSSDFLMITAYKLKQALALHKEDLLDTIFPLPDATEFTKGISRFGTVTEVLDGVLDNVGVSPARLEAKLLAFSPFDFTVRNDLSVDNNVDITQTLTCNTANATTLNVNNLNVLDEALFPFNVRFTARVDFIDATVVGLRVATESLDGVVKICTQQEALAGVNNENVVTPLKLKTVLDDRFPLATTSLYGIVRLATIDETRSGIIESAVITPAAFSIVINELLTALDTELKALIAALDAELKALITALDSSLTSAMSSLDSELQALINALDSELKGLMTTLNSELRALITALDTQLDALTLNFSTHQATVMEALGNIDGLIVGLGEVDQSLQEQINNLFTLINGIITEALQTLTNDVGTLTGNVTTLGEDIQSIYDLITQLQAMDASLQDQINSINAYIAAALEPILGNIANLQTDAEANANNISTLQGNIGTINGRLGNIERTLGTLDGRIATLEANQITTATVSSLITAHWNTTVRPYITAQVNALNANISSIDDRVAVLEAG